LSERIALLQFGWQGIPDLWSGSSKTPIAVSVPCASNNTRHWIGWAESARMDVRNVLNCLLTCALDILLLTDLITLWKRVV